MRKCVVNMKKKMSKVKKFKHIEEEEKNNMNTFTCHINIPKKKKEKKKKESYEELIESCGLLLIDVKGDVEVWEKHYLNV